MRFGLVHLDLDGTFLDTRADLAASTNHVRQRFGLEPLVPEGVYALVGRGARVLVERALGPERRESHDEAVTIFLEHYAEHCLDATEAYPGMVELVDRLRDEGVLFSVVTNKPEALARRILDGLGLSSRLVALVGGDTLPDRKPDPAGVELAAEGIGVARERWLMVGDSAVDVDTARNAGIVACGVLWGLDPEGVVEARPDVLVATAAELEAVIRG